MNSDLATLVYDRLKTYAPLTALLCKYAELPAVFYQNAPDDQQTAWGGKTQYPRVVFDIDEQANTERKSSGTLIVEVFCDRAGTEPEQIEPIIRECLKDLLIKPHGSFPYCFSWARTDAFVVKSIKEGGTAQRAAIGQEIRFDMLEYPKQDTTDPDPVAALCAFLLEEYPDACIVGLSPMGSYTEATAEKPVVYCRLESIETDSVTNTVAWMDARIAIHIICSLPETRLKIAADIQNLLMWSAEIIMLDGSPMRPLRVSLSNTADYLKEGQLRGVFHYGVLRWRAKPHQIISSTSDLQAE